MHVRQETGQRDKTAGFPDVAHVNPAEVKIATILEHDVDPSTQAAVAHNGPEKLGRP